MPKRTIAFRVLQNRLVHALLHDPTVINRKSCWAAIWNWLNLDTINHAFWTRRSESQQAYALDQIWQRIQAERIAAGIPIFPHTKQGRLAEARHKKKRQPI